MVSEAVHARSARRYPPVHTLGASHAYPRHQSKHHALDDDKDWGGRQSGGLSRRRSHRRQSRVRAGQHRGLFRRSVLRSGPHRGDRQGARRGRLRHRLFRRYRARGGAMRDVGAGDRHRRSRLSHGEPDRGEIQRRDHALAFDRSDRAQSREIRAYLPLRPRPRRGSSGAGARGARLRRAAAHRTGNRARARAKTAQRRSCSAAPA